MQRYGDFCVTCDWCSKRRSMMTIEAQRKLIDVLIPIFELFVCLLCKHVNDISITHNFTPVIHNGDRGELTAFSRAQIKLNRKGGELIATSIKSNVIENLLKLCDLGMESSIIQDIFKIRMYKT